MRRRLGRRSRQDAEGSDDDEWEEMDGEEGMAEGEAERKGALAAAAAVGRAVDDLAELNMDAYDDEPDSGFDLFIDNGMAYRDQKEDPYLLAGADVRIPSAPCSASCLPAGEADEHDDCR